MEGLERSRGTVQSDRIHSCSGNVGALSFVDLGARSSAFVDPAGPVDDDSGVVV